MKKHIVIGIIIGVLFSGIVYAVGSQTSNRVIGSDNIKIEIENTSGAVATGKVLVNIDEKWYRFENSAYMRLIKDNQ